MSHFVLEIGVEELPARFLASLERDLHDRFETLFREHALTFDSLTVDTTPRRAVVHARGLLSSTPVREEVALGPSVKAAYDAEGNPTKAALGFARGQGTDVSALFRQQTPKGEYVAVRKSVGGVSASSIIAEAAPSLIASLPFPKRMHWGPSHFLFARPLRWVVALMDDKVVPFTVADVQSGRMTTGHRVHGRGPFEVASADDFDAVMAEKCGVTLSGAERRRVVVEGGNALARSVNGRILWKESLLDEVQGLCEHPEPILGGFDPSFLELPSVVLLTSMETHQKSFGVESADGKLLPYFLTVANLTSREPDVVKKGWERVLRARLEDARFYWNTDMKASFEVWKEKLDHVIFLGPLGSMGDKCRRLSELCRWLAGQEGVARAAKVDPESAAVAGRCAKADLVSQMVGEFDTLQGIMGGIYAERKGETPVVAQALREQYLPAGPDSPVPASLCGALLSMADKADTLVGCFGLGMIPTGAADPNALRRCALGIIRIALEFDLHFDIRQLFARAHELYGDRQWKLAPQEALDKLLDFFAGRVRNYWQNRGEDSLLVDAALGAGVADVCQCGARLAALAQFSKEAGYAEAVQTFKRVANIVRKQGAAEQLAAAWQADLLQEDAEKALAATLDDLLPRLDSLWEAGDHTAALKTLLEVRPVVDAFFDGVMVMCDDAALRANRLAMLNALGTRFARLADFAALQI